MNRLRAWRTVHGAVLQAFFGALCIAAEAPRGWAQCEPAIEFVSDRTQVPTRAAHALAFSGSALGLIKVEPPNGPLHFALYDLDLHQMTTDVRVADSFESGTADLFWTGTSFGFFYGSATKLIYQQISAEGNLIGGAVAVPLRSGITTGDHDVTFDPVRGLYIIVHSVRSGLDRGVWMTFFSPAGAKTREDLISQSVLAFDPDVRVAVTEQGTIGILYLNSRDEIFRFVTVSASNVVRPEVQVMTTHRAPFIAANDTEFILVFRATKTMGSDLTWIRLDSTGAVIMDEATLLAGNVDVAPVDVFWNSELEEWAMAHVASFGGFAIDPGEYRILRFLRDGTVIDNSLFAPDPLRKIFRGRNSFVFADNGYVSPADLPISQNVTESYLLRYCPFAVVAEIDRRNVNVGGLVGFSARPSGGTAQYNFEWDFGDNTKAFGQFVEHMFTTPGVYTVRVTATDATGRIVTDTEQISVLDPKRRAVRK